MGQTFTDDTYDGAHVAATDLANIEVNFATLKSCFSGATAPAGAVAGMQYYNTTNNISLRRNTANSAWVGLMHGDVSQKMWVYRNTAMDGWVIDATPTDRVLALKGGSTYTTGGASAGSWSTAAHLHASGTLTASSHTHQWYNNSGSGITSDSMYNAAGTEFSLISTSVLSGVDKNSSSYGITNVGTPVAASISTLIDLGVSLTQPSVSGNTATDGITSTARPSASVGTLQYLDIP